MTLEARADLGPGRNVYVFLNGDAFGPLFLAGTTCPQNPETDTLTVTATEFNGLLGDERELSVELEARVERRTKRGQTLVALQHVVTNQRGEIVVTFTERVVFDPAE